MFSLRTLLLIVAVAALFTAALLYRTPLWVVVSVNATIVFLLAATLGVWLERLDRIFWLPFCAVGWFYLLLSFTPTTVNHLVYCLPSKQISYALRSANYEETVGRFTISEMMDVVMYESPFEQRDDDKMTVFEFRRGVNILDALSALIAAGIAGVIASLLLRQHPER